MSLTGNLEDLGLGDILQIISLSRKSGTLRISALRGEARIVFREGQVRGALAPGSPVDFCAMLTASGAVAKDDFKYAEEESASTGRRVSEVLLAKQLITEERLETLRREVAESAVIEIFEWRSGEFCFDIGETEDPALEMFATGGINAQYLAMEASRRRDESSLETPENVDDPMGFAELGDEIRSAGAAADTNLSIEAAPSIELHAEQSIAERMDADLPAERAPGLSAVAHAESAPSASEADAMPDETPFEDVEPLLSDEIASEWPAADELSTASLLETQYSVGLPSEEEERDPNEDTARSHYGDAVDNLASAASVSATPSGSASVVSSMPVVAEERQSVSPPPASARDAVEALPPVILIDMHLPVLEWIKKALSNTFEHVHIFQRTNLAVGRVRQYLARGQVPILIIAPDAPPDTLTGAKNAEDLVQRLRKQSPRMLVLTLGEGAEQKTIAGTQGLLEVPAVSQLLDVRRAAENEAFQETLHQNVLYLLRNFTTQSRVRRTTKAEGTDSQRQTLQRLRDASACLREASQRGDVLESMLRFVSERFARVALFLVREDMAEGLSQIGLERAEGPTSAEMAQVSIPVREPAWFKSVLDMRTPICCAPSNDGDRKLAGLLGRIVPDEAYVAPIESGGQVIALLYADNLPERAPIGDTSALEVLLHQAGLALDRSFFERLIQERSS